MTLPTVMKTTYDVLFIKDEGNYKVSYRRRNLK